MTKRILIPWSGGLDSTALVISAYSHNIPFDTCFFKINNNVQLQIEELKARKKILKYLKKQHSMQPHISDVISNINAINVPSDAQLLLPALLIATLLMTVNLKLYSEIQFGYIKGDDFWHVKEHFEKMFYSGFKMTRSAEIPKITYPFEWHKKDQIKRDYYSGEYETIFNKIWFCEKPENRTPCEKCTSCIRHYNEIK